MEVLRNGPACAAYAGRVSIVGRNLYMEYMYIVLNINKLANTYLDAKVLHDNLRNFMALSFFIVNVHKVVDNVLRAKPTKWTGFHCYCVKTQEETLSMEC